MIYVGNELIIFQVYCVHRQYYILIFFEKNSHYTRSNRVAGRQLAWWSPKQLTRWSSRFIFRHQNISFGLLLGIALKNQSRFNIYSQYCKIVARFLKTSKQTLRKKKYSLLFNLFQVDSRWRFCLPSAAPWSSSSCCSSFSIGTTGTNTAKLILPLHKWCKIVARFWCIIWRALWVAPGHMCMGYT